MTSFVAALLLGPDQADMVRHLTNSGHGVDVVLGVAGAGKTTALECAHALWEASGHPTMGIALAARAAIELETRSGIPSTTLDSLLTALDRPDLGLPAHAVIVVDEAAMVDTRRLARFLTHTERAGAKVILVGDPHQLPEIGAGGAFAGLAARFRPSCSTSIAAKPTRSIVKRSSISAPATLRRRSNVSSPTDASRSPRPSDAARQQMVDDWLTAQRNGTDTVMLAARRADVDKLNHQARTRLVDTGARAVRWPHRVRPRIRHR